MAFTNCRLSGLFQHTAARRRLGWQGTAKNCPKVQFQHTAARRRLAIRCIRLERPFLVSTHSRPKAAGA